MKLISLNVARPRLTVYNGQTINTGIFKAACLRAGSAADAQSGWRSAGRPDRARRPQQGGLRLSFGALRAFGGRNCRGRIFLGACSGRTSRPRVCSNPSLHIGDRLQIGSAILMVRQPRIPCYKLAAKFQAQRHSGALSAQRTQRILFLGGAGRQVSSRRVF